MEKYYKICDVTILVRSELNDYFISRMKEYEITPVLKPDVIFNCHLAENLEIPKGKEIGCVNSRHWLRLNDGGYANYDYDENVNKCLAVVISNKDWSEINCTLCDTEKVFKIEPRCLVFNALGEIFRFIMLKRNGIVIHSSSMSYKNQGILFSAPSETGKSTHTGLWRKYYPDETCIINDDTPTIVIKDGIPILFGTPWSGTSEINMNKSVPLKAIVFLRRGDKNTISPLNPIQAISYLANEIRLPLDSDLMDLTFNMINEIFKTVPCYLLHCNISKEAVETVKNTIFK